MSASASPAQNKETRIQVVARFRPLNKIEIEEGGKVSVELDKDEMTCIVNPVDGSKPLRFTFDRAFPQTCQQKDIYEYVGAPVVKDIFNGYNGTIFVYGQTGSGKTFTMMGPNTNNTGYCDDPNLKGLIPRIVDSIFKTVDEADPNIEFSIKVSYIEIYLEKIRDLFDPSKQNLQLKEERDGRGVFVSDVTEAYVSSGEEVFMLMKRGAQNRIVASTRMNEESSRSHSIFMITISQKDVVTLEAKTGKLFLVDLAGSEKVKKTQAKGQQLEEAKMINKSLSALGNVINALTDGKSTHVPYRDSKLTRLLQDSLGGNSRTTLIINCSMASYNEFETVSTLRFGTRAKNIKNQPKVNRELSVRELQILLEAAEKEITRQRQYIAGLEDELKLLGGNVSNARASSEALSQLENMPNVAKLRDEVTELENRLNAKEDELKSLVDERDDLQDQLQSKIEELAKKTASLEALETAYASLKDEFDRLQQENDFIVNKLADFTILKDKLEFEVKEKTITLQSLTANNDALNQELDQLKATIVALRSQLEQQTLPKKTGNDKADKLLTSWEKERQASKKEEEEFKKKMEEKIQRIEEIGSPVHRDQDAESEPKVEVPQPQPIPAEREKELLDKIAQLEQQLSEEVNMRKQQEELLQQHQQRLLQAQEQASTAASEAATEQPAAKAPQEDAGSVVGEETDKKEEAVVPALSSEEAMREIESLRSQLQTAIENHKKELQQKNCEIEKLKDDHEWQVSKMTASFQNQMSFLGQREKEIKTEKEVSEREKDEKLKSYEKEIEMYKKEAKNLREEVQKQRKEFEQLRNALLKDLQNRCEKVIDLEMSLDEAREEYKQLLINSSSKALKKKVIFLERNNEQLTNSFQQLYNQNSSLKLELQLAEKKLAIRNDRIHNLEFLLEDAKDIAKAQAEAYQSERLKFTQEIEHYRNEIIQLQEQLMRVSSSSSASLGGRPFNDTTTSVGSAGKKKPAPQLVPTARIVKPIRGGGGRKAAAASNNNNSVFTITTPTSSTNGKQNVFSSSTPPPPYVDMPLSPDSTTSHYATPSTPQTPYGGSDTAGILQPKQMQFESPNMQQQQRKFSFSLFNKSPRNTPPHDANNNNNNNNMYSSNRMGTNNNDQQDDYI